MSKAIVTRFIFPLFLLFAGSKRQAALGLPKAKQSPNNQNVDGTWKKIIVENASVTLNLDLNKVNGSRSLVARPVTLHFAAAANSFFPILVLNDQLQPTGSIALVPQAQPKSLLPAALAGSY